MTNLGNLLPQMGTGRAFFGTDLDEACNEALLEEAREQAAAEARVSCQDEYAVKLSQLVQSQVDELQAVRKMWIEEESATLALHVRRSIETTSFELACAVEQILTPFVRSLLPQAVVAELVTKVRIAAVSDLAGAARLAGPEDLVSKTKEKLILAGYEVGSFSDRQNALGVQIDDTQIISNLEQWLSALDGESHG